MSPAERGRQASGASCLWYLVVLDREGAPDNAALAQQAEQAPCKGKVIGSKPLGGSPGSSKGRARLFGSRCVGSSPAPGTRYHWKVQNRAPVAQ